MLNSSFKKKFDEEKNPLYKSIVKNDLEIFMKKMDSIENVALIGALLKVKNTEDLRNIKNKNLDQKNEKNFTGIEKIANYPGGMNALRKEISQLFYTDAVHSETSNIKTNIGFIVEKDGSISNVIAEGDNYSFNRQAEIAMYSVTEKFIPAYHNGNPVPYYFTLPLILNFE